MTAAHVFFCYAHEDRTLRDELATHLVPLQRAGQLSSFFDGDIAPGAKWDIEIKRQLEKADIILLLVSPDFLNSEYIHEIELRRAMQRHQFGQMQVIPILVRPAYLADTAFATLQVLPQNGKPVVLWADRDEAWVHVVEELRRIL